MGLFSRPAASFLDRDDETWVIETLGWLDAHIDPPGWLLSRPTVLPTPTFFPPTDLTGHQRAAFIFDTVRGHMGMRDWNCELVAQPPRPSLAIPGIPYHGGIQQGGAAGTFGISGNVALITYDPAEIARPMTLIAIFAHELAHYRLAGLAERPPGGPDLAEPATDLTALAFGFGIFGASAAFDYQQHQDYQGVGWQTRRLGYLPERVWMFGLAAVLLNAGRNKWPVALAAGAVPALSPLQRPSDCG
jgi:hypothetical protein